MGYIKSFKKFQSLIKENKEQSLKILKKLEVSQDNEIYQEIKKELLSVFNNLNYLGLMTKYFFEQDVSLQEIKDLLPWLKQNSSKLSNQPLSYKNFEELKDEIIQIDNNQKVKTVLKILPSKLKKLVSLNDEKFKELSISIFELSLIEELSQKISSVNTRDGLIDRMKDFIDKNTKKYNLNSLTKFIKQTNSKVLKVDTEEKLVLAEIHDYKASKKLGSNNWCISYSENNWNSYTGGTNRQFFVWNLQEEPINKNYLIGFTVDQFGNIINIHDKFDKSLTGKIPEFLNDLISGLDFSMDRFEFKSKLKRNLSEGSGEEINSSDDNIVIIQLKNRIDLKHFKFFKNLQHINVEFYRDNIFSYSSTREILNNFYFVFNFNYRFDDEEFCYYVKSSKDNFSEHYLIGSKTENKYFSNKESVKGNAPYFLYENMDNFIPLDINETIDDLKDYTLDILEDNYVKNKTTDGIDYINTSEEYGSTGNLWLFKIKNIQKLENFKILNFFPSRSDYKFKETKFLKYNLYVLVDIDQNLNSQSFFRIFIAQEDSPKTIHQSTSYIKDCEISNNIPQDIEKLIEKGLIKLKTKEDLKREINRHTEKLIEKSLDRYNEDPSLEYYGKLIFDHYSEIERINGKIDLEYYGFSEEDLKEDPKLFKKIIRPLSGSSNISKSFDILDPFSIKLTGYGEGVKIGTEEMYSKEVKDKMYDMAETDGLENLFNNDFLENYLDMKFLKDEVYNDFEEVVSNQLEQELGDLIHDEVIEVNLQKWAEEKIESLEEEISSLEEEIQEEEDDETIEELEDKKQQKEEEKEELLYDKTNLDVYEVDDDSYQRFFEDRTQKLFQEEVLIDPISYVSDYMNQPLNYFVDIDQAIEDAIDTDGWDHFFDSEHEEEVVKDGETFILMKEW
jgi:hypothetical protein